MLPSSETSELNPPPTVALHATSLPYSKELAFKISASSKRTSNSILAQKATRRCAIQNKSNMILGTQQDSYMLSPRWRSIERIPGKGTGQRARYYSPAGCWPFSNSCARTTHRGHARFPQISGQHLWPMIRGSPSRLSTLEV